MSAYTLGDVARICGVSRQRLRYWERTALVEPSVFSGAQPAFDFRDLASVRSIVGLLDGGVPLRRIRHTVEAVRERLPEVGPRPLLRLRTVAGRVVIRHEGVLMEPDGQLVLELGAACAAVAPLEPRGLVPGSPEAWRAARAWFERGCALDSDPATYEEAAEAYRRAIDADPTCADAYCNLGSIHFNCDRRERARECFEQAVAFVTGHVEANLNLGALCEDDGRQERALRHYRVALESDPLHPDAHVSIALLYEKLSLRRTARVHWKRYLQLDPAGAWADVARHRLN